ncbi:hypothetical protein J3F83DRAFT_745941 [Trichoderma novae-zelandiae]
MGHRVILSVLLASPRQSTLPVLVRACRFRQPCSCCTWIVRVTIPRYCLDAARHGCVSTPCPLMLNNQFAVLHRLLFGGFATLGQGAHGLTLIRRIRSTSSDSWPG